MVADDLGLSEELKAQRFEGIKRDYTQEDVRRLQGSVQVKHTLAERGAWRLWKDLNERDYVNALGTYTGNQAVQMAKAGLRSIYLSGWQVAADANLAGQTYPDQSLYPSNSVPTVVNRINEAFRRADQIQTMENMDGGNAGNIDYFLPIMADAEAGFGGTLNAFELMRWMIEAGAAGVHFEDQLASEKKCGHLGGKVLVPIRNFIKTLNAARLAADVEGVPTLIVARTDAQSAQLITSDIDERDHPFIDFDNRTEEGFYRIKQGHGVDYCIHRQKIFAPYADLLWWETSTPDLDEARRFAEEIHKHYPGKMLAYNCSPSFNWKRHLDDETIRTFQKELAAMGYTYQFVTLAGFHQVLHGAFEMARQYRERGMEAYAELQQAEFESEQYGYSATRHQREVGTGYFDAVNMAVSGGSANTGAMAGSTETAQFKKG